MAKDNNKNNKNKMTEKELDKLAEKIALKVAAKLIDLQDISDWFRGTNYTFKPFMSDNIYKPYKRKEFKLNEEEELIGELSKLMTLMNLYEEKEEYEKCANIKKKIDKIQKRLENL
jgi:hypothetical protein